MNIKCVKEKTLLMAENLTSRIKINKVHSTSNIKLKKVEQIRNCQIASKFSESKKYNKYLN